VTVEFRLLGLLEVTGDDGRAIAIVRGHESGLLALLLLHANEALSPERIVETVAKYYGAIVVACPPRRGNRNFETQATDRQHS